MIAGKIARQKIQNRKINIDDLSILSRKWLRTRKTVRHHVLDPMHILGSWPNRCCDNQGWRSINC